ncbi:MAG: NUDIX domain-containing protein [Patescibacteria group bacterium]|jgi:isopentenyldiphosphate isomerase
MNEKNELMIVVDNSNNAIGKATMEEIRKKGLNHRSVHIFIFNKDNELLICKRPHFKKAYPNMYTSSAGGKVNFGETFEESANRELKEELGIVTELSKVGSYVIENELKNNKVFHELFYGMSEGPFNLDPNEIVQCEFVKLDEISKRIKKDNNNFVRPFIDAFKLYLKINDTKKS